MMDGLRSHLSSPMVSHQWLYEISVNRSRATLYLKTQDYAFNLNENCGPWPHDLGFSEVGTRVRSGPIHSSKVWSGLTDGQAEEQTG